MNINYTAEESRLATEIDHYPGREPSDHGFFLTVPELDDNPVVRYYQERYVERLLSVSFNYPNVLYCMNNESGEHPEWGEYWARFIREKADQAGKEVFLADMRRYINLYAEEHTRILHDRVHSNHLLSDRESNEAYCLAEEGKQYALYFPESGDVVLDLSGSSGRMTIRWLDIMSSEWLEEQTLEGNGPVRISPPGDGQWAALILP